MSSAQMYSVCIFQPYTEKRCWEREKEGEKEESKEDLKGNEGERAGICRYYYSDKMDAVAKPYNVTDETIIEYNPEDCNRSPG